MVALLGCAGERILARDGYQLQITRARPVDRNPAELQVRWFGTTCYALQLGQLVIVTDPYVTIGDPAAVESARVRAVLGDLDPEPRAVFVNHMHTDHFLHTAPALRAWKERGLDVPVYAGRTAAHILAGFGEGLERAVRDVRAAPTGEVGPAPDGHYLRYRAFPSRHTPHLCLKPWWSFTALDGVQSEPLDAPPCLTDYVSGEVHNFVFELYRAEATGTPAPQDPCLYRLVFLVSPHDDHVGVLEDYMREAKRVDALFLMAEAKVEGYPARFLKLFEPRHIVPTHFNEFFFVEPGSRREEEVLFVAEFGEFLRELQTAATYREFRSILVPGLPRFDGDWLRGNALVIPSGP